MAPTKLTARSVVGGSLASQNGQNIMNTRTRSSINGIKLPKDVHKLNGKRKANSPLKDVTAKRAAFGDITNAIVKNTANDKENVNVLKKVAVRSKELSVIKAIKQKCNENFPPAASKGLKLRSIKSSSNSENKAPKLIGKDCTKVAAHPVAAKSLPVQTLINQQTKLPGSKESQRSTKSQRCSDEPSEQSLYISALEDNTAIPLDTKSYQSAKSVEINVDNLEQSFNRIVRLPTITVPEGVTDFDKEHWNDPLQVPHYAMDIFNYLKTREAHFKIHDYMPRQASLTGWMRALLVDWMVEVQESFELNHETLYLGVKLVDLYLCKEVAAKEQLQLVGAASLFIAAKYDERVPPLVEDFLYICDGAYTLKELLRMEIRIFKTIGYDLGIPLSYRFLRRYARCAHASMPTLTLARYVLELCLMEYAVVVLSDSKMAAAALYLALRMKGVSGWTSTLVYYSGYSLEEILPIVHIQNAYLHKKPKEASLRTVRNKYSHKIFFEVAKIPLIDNTAL